MVFINHSTSVTPQDFDEHREHEALRNISNDDFFYVLAQYSTGSPRTTT
jgi:hypothetical protein